MTAVDDLWIDDYKLGFYDSCKEVKFGAANTPAMSFIGGGAKNASQFLGFLGKKNPPLGSPFQINFPNVTKNDVSGMVPVVETPVSCNSTDTKYHCSCVDCSDSCPDLAEITESHECHVGSWPCLSFAVVLIYALGLLLLVVAVTGHVAYQKRTKDHNERLRLLHDTDISDDEDDADSIMYQPSPYGRPARRYFLNTLCDRTFSRLGHACATFPAITISTSAAVVILLSLGWLRFAIETNPVRLWVAPDSAAAREKVFFDENFGPFFRTEQVFLINDTSSEGPAPILSYDTLKWWFEVERRIQRLKSGDGNTTLDEICYKPTGDACVVQSSSGYFQNGISSKTWKDDLEGCTTNPADTDCLPDFGLPLNPRLILGGWNESALDAKAIITTWVINNYAEDSPKIESAEQWENRLKQFILDEVQGEAEKRGLRLSFNTEISLEQELNKTTNTDANIVVVSYIIMFIYASLALGSTTLAVREAVRKPSTALIQSKFMLGTVGIIIVLLSVSASVGLFSAAGVKVTLIIAEVIPFLVLAIGVDNIFLIVHEFERINVSHPDKPVEDRIANALGRMGPSILLSASMETIAFALGGFVSMPAVRNFAAYAAGAVVINTLLQVTMFVATLALNQKRVEAGRADCVPCVRVRPPIGLYEDNAPEDDSLQRFIRRTYAPALLGNKTKAVITVIFLGLFTAGLALLPSIQLGLDQRIAIPSESYLISYFNDLYDYFDAGAPLYFVARTVNATERSHQQQLCGRFSTCNEFSLANILEQERKRPGVSFIAEPTANWVDDFFLWLNPSLEQCCVNPRTQEPCFADREAPWNTTLYGMPEGFEYMSYLRRWLHAPTTPDCALGGQAGYSSAVVLPNSTEIDPTVLASHFRTSHTPLRSQSDFIDAYASARRIASLISASNPGLEVFPYSKFYIFFDPYATIVHLSLSLLGAALAACLLVCALLLGSLRTALVVALTVAMTLVDIAGVMALAGVSLNPVTLVNLVICVGIAVEFCAHIARAFQFPEQRLLADGAVVVPHLLHPSATAGGAARPRKPNTASAALASLGRPSASRFQPPQLQQHGPNSDPMRNRGLRAWAALSQVGASVFSGITLTKLLGVCVLAFTRSKIFEVYYFRVWLALVVLGAAHALVWLPVALSWMGGGAGFVSSGDDGDDSVGGGGLEEDLRRRRMGWGGVDGEGFRDEEDDEM